MITFEVGDKDDTIKLAEVAGKYIKEGTTLLLIGNLGAGKTFFSKYLIKTLGVEEEVTSPTFNLMNIYEGICPIYHFDLYRLENTEELFDIGFYEYLDSDEGIVLVEWADKFMDEMPENAVTVKFKITDLNEREIIFSGSGEKAEEFLERLKEVAL